MKILFLDIDGVLNTLLPHESHGPFSKAACAHVNALLAKVPDLQIVMSSAWRRHGINACKQILQEQGIDGTRVVGMTSPQKEVGIMDREKEIMDWLALNPNVSNYVIVDDYFAMPLLQDRFVKTNSYVGFTEADKKKALKILGHEK
jgi:hypothetical protein